MLRSLIFYPKGAGFDGALLRAFRAAIVNASLILICASVAVTVESRSLDWIFHLDLWIFYCAILATFWCIALLYEWRCKRRREKRPRNYRAELQRMALKQNGEL